MTTAVWSPSSVTSYDNSPPDDTVWSTPTTVTIAAGHGGQIREFDSGTVLDVVHDGCVITNIKVEFTGSKVSFGTAIYAYASFHSVVASTSALSSTPTNYSANGGSGTLPSVVRAALAYSSCRNNDASLSANVNMSLPIVTITYTDNGIPYMMQFSL